MTVRSLQIVDTLGMGGAETWLMEVLRLWSRSGAGRMDFVATSGRRGLFDEEAEALGAKIHYIPYGRTRLPAFAGAFRKVLREGVYDAVHDHQDYASGWHFLMGGGALPPVRVTHVHNPAYQIRNNYGVTLGRRLTAKVGKTLVARFATHIAGTSHQVIGEYGFGAQAFRRIPTAAVYCGFDPGRFTADPGRARADLLAEFGWPPEARIALFAGRIDVSPDPIHPQAHKNAGFAVNVAIAAARRDKRVRLLLAGALSPAVPVLERRIAEAGLAGSILFAGVRRDIEKLMAGADVLLFPSRGEGLGMAAVEAQAAGLPVLASDTVPREAAVIADLIRFKPLAAAVEAWADELLDLVERPHDPTANAKVAASPFAIVNSARALAVLYAGEAGGS
jgi:glycosyltransferase involved in cell wall biosynthesis